MNKTINSVINFLRCFYLAGYSFAVAAKSATGRRNPCNLKATRHAPCVFFYVVAMAHLFQVWCFVAVFCQLRRIIKIMVARAGQSSDWPVSFRAGIPTPVRATTHECRNSGGSVNRYLKEIATMAITPGFPHPEYTFLFLSVRRADGNSRPSPVRITAQNERAARLSLFSAFVFCFAGRLPVSSAGQGRV